MCFARLVTHYWRHAAWRSEGELLAGGAISDHFTDTLDRFAVLDDERGRDRM
jgi:proline iminopeptidase